MLLASVLIVFATVILAAPITHAMGRRAGWVLCWPLFIAAGILIAQFVQHDESSEYYPWIPDLFSVGLHLRLDGLSLMFSLLVLIIGGLVLFYSVNYLGTTKNISFYLTMSTFALAMLLLVLSNDLMVLYVSWEATTLSSFFLISRSGAHARQPAIRTLLVTVAGGLVLLTAVCIMIISSGTTVVSDILVSDMWENTGLTALLAVLVAVAAFTKSAQFPFQSWLPDSMVAISPVSAYLHAAAMVKAGVYLLLLFSPVFAQVLTWNLLLIIAGLTTAIIGAISANRRYDLKELLAYSTMSQLGYLVALIGVGTKLALTAAVVHTIAHALFKSSLFLSVGVIDHEAGTRDMRMLAAAKVRMPITLTTIILSAASMAGFPTLLGFVSKENLFDAFLNASLPGIMPVLVLLAGAVAAVFTFAYSGRLIIGAAGKYRSPANWVNIPRSHNGEVKEIHDGAFSFVLVPLLNAVAGLVLGAAPFLLNTLVSRATSTAFGAEVHVHLAFWHGFNIPLLISACVIIIGFIIMWKAPAMEAFMVPKQFPIAGLGVVEKTRTAIINIGAVVGEATSGLNPGRHLLVPSAGIGVIGIIGLFTIHDLPGRQDNLTRPTDWALVLLILVGVIATVAAKTRIQALIVVGVVGFSTTMWFFALGSVDVALTQLLVEILTVTVMVLLLKRLPRKFAKRTPLRTTWASIAAIFAGLAAGMGVWAFTGRREMSDVGQYLTQYGTQVSGSNNLVNVILVEFRAFDTLGELTVLGVAGLAVAALLASRKPEQVHESKARLTSPLSFSYDNNVFLRTFAYIAGPVFVLLSLVMLVRGHNEPGGGFIAALLGGSTLALIYLSAQTDTPRALVRLNYLWFIGSGIALGALVGIWGLVDGSFLKPLHADIWGLHLNSALLFDLGVYLAVLGLVLAAINLLGADESVKLKVLPKDLPKPASKPQGPPKGLLEDDELPEELVSTTEVTR